MLQALLTLIALCALQPMPVQRRAEQGAAIHAGDRAALPAVHATIRAAGSCHAAAVLPASSFAPRTTGDVYLVVVDAPERPARSARLWLEQQRLLC